MKPKKWFAVFIVFAVVCSVSTVSAKSSKSSGKSSASQEPENKSSQDDEAKYRKAFEEMEPYVRSWTADSTELALSEDDGKAEPREIAEAAVRKASVFYRGAMEKAWSELPNDGANTPQSEVDQFEKNLVETVTENVLENRKNPVKKAEPEAVRSTPDAPADSEDEETSEQAN